MNIKTNCPVCFIILFILFVLISACNNSNHYEVDLSEVPIKPVEVKRYEVALFNANPYNLLVDLEAYADEFELFLGDGLLSEAGQKQLFEFVTDPFLQDLYYDVMEKYPDVDEIEDELSKAFRYYRYYYPEEENPLAYSYVSGIDYMMPVKYADGHLIIGLDMYLGKDYINYERAGIPVFKRISFNQEYIVADVMKVMAEKSMSETGFVPAHFLDYMIHEGKILYFLDRMIPFKNDSVKIAYSENQLQWIEDNLRLVWTYFIDNELLYSTDRQLIKQFIGDAPFTVDFGTNSAPRAGVYIGWQIVRKFMDRHPDVTLQELLTERNAQEVLNKSNFRP